MADSLLNSEKIGDGETKKSLMNTKKALISQPHIPNSYNGGCHLPQKLVLYIMSKFIMIPSLQCDSKRKQKSKTGFGTKN